MNKGTTIKICVILLLMAGACRAACRTKSSGPAKANDKNVETILERLNKKTKELQSYETQVEYKFSQPLLESESVRKGVLYYSKNNKKSMLRINFQTLKQDDEKEQKCPEHYIFDGVWLTHIDYQIKTATQRQLAEPNEPMDAFDLVSRNLPIIGFAKIEDLKNEFDIQLIEQERSEPSAFIQLHLKVQPDSTYEDDYTYMDFWIDKELYLPSKVVAVSTEEDIYEIKFLKPKVNKKMGKKVFEFKIPGGFSVETKPLKNQESPEAED